ncbi:hypothetical protein HYW43_01965 [Candidatus Daviesbacteria bacterium]|nr:hypothetical protein [Candidatus Daviesbacteria bacterium]
MSGLLSDKEKAGLRRYERKQALTAEDPSIAPRRMNPDRRRFVSRHDSDALMRMRHSRTDFDHRDKLTVPVWQLRAPTITAEDFWPDEGLDNYDPVYSGAEEAIEAAKFSVVTTNSHLPERHLAYESASPVVQEGNGLGAIGLKLAERVRTLLSQDPTRVSYLEELGVLEPVAGPPPQEAAGGLRVLSLSELNQGPFVPPLKPSFGYGGPV